MSNSLYPSAPTRPRPIADAFKSVGSAVSFGGSVATSLVGWGVLSAAQGDAVTGLLGLIPGVVTGVTQLVQAFVVLRRAEPATTPGEDPIVIVNGHAVPLTPDMADVDAAVAALPGPFAA